MAAKLQEIEAKYIGEFFRRDNFVLAEVELCNGSAKGFDSRFITVKGDAEPDELQPRGRYRFYGRTSNYRNKKTGQDEKQFNFQTFVQAQSHDREGVIEYLARAGAGNGMGRGTAAKLWEAFGSDAIRIIREDPDQLRAVNNRITAEQAERISKILDSQKATEDATVELTNLLAGRGFPKTTARKAIKKWGNRAAQVIGRDPYALMAFRGCGFKTCDALWLELGHSPDRLRRQALCAWHSVASNTDGHTWFPVETVVQAIRQSIGSTKARPKQAIKLALRLARLSPNHYGALAGIRSDGVSGPIIDEGGRVWIAEGRKAEAERTLAELVDSAIDEARPRTITEYESHQLRWEEAVSAIQCRRCGRELTAPEVHVWGGKPFGPTCIGYISNGEGVDVLPLADWIDMQPPKVQSEVYDLPYCQTKPPCFSLWPDPASIAGIDDHQREKLAEALISRVAILGGSPGTGKTYATARLILALLQSGLVGPQDIAIGCPTGKAAVRITEVMQAAGVPLQARTWHSLLGVGEADEEGGDWGFCHNESNPWPFRVIIGDESSMLDTALFRSIMAARPRGCHALFVGDVNQLPPVGNGAPLRDLIASRCVGYGELTEIKRNSGGIVEACAAIRDGQPWQEGDNLVVNSNPDQLLQTLATLTMASGRGFDPVWDCQVLVAVNARSPLSRKKVNERLQAELNSNPEIKGTPFRLADKIVCLKNGRYTAVEADDEAKEETDGNEAYVANGELAEVIEIEEKSMIAKLTSPHRVIRIPRGKSQESEGDDDKAASTGCSWDLAYGLSVHRAQGSEWPVVITLIDEYPGARRICDRSWIYTALSRAKEKQVLIGRKATADAMCRRLNITKRKTFLRELVQLAISERSIEAIG